MPNPRFNNMLGERIGSVLVMQRLANDFGSAVWECKCDTCAHVFSVISSRLRRLETLSKNGISPCPQCRTKQAKYALEEKLDMKRASQLKYEASCKQRGGLTAGKLHQKLAQRLLAARNAVTPGAYRQGFEQAVNIVEEILNVRIITD